MTKTHDLLKLTRADSDDDPRTVTPRNTEVACAYAIRAARKWAARKLMPWMDPVFMEEEAIDAVMRATVSYDPTRGTTFFTYCVAKVLGKIREADRTLRKRKPDVELDVQGLGLPGFHGDFFNDYQKGDFYALRIDRTKDDQTDVEREVIEEYSIAFILTDLSDKANLTKRQNEVLRLKYVDGLRQVDIAKHFGITPGRVHQIELIALQKLRPIMLAHGIS